MNSIRLDKKLNPYLRARVSVLIDNPYAGSKAFNNTHPDAEYVSNCHGINVFAFCLDQYLGRLCQPKEFDDVEMEIIIKRHFLPSKEFRLGCLTAFYEGSKRGTESLLHTGLLIDSNETMFHQPGTGEVFGTRTIEEEKKILKYLLKTNDIEARSYSLRS